jgi:hypothetical protein
MTTESCIKLPRVPRRSFGATSAAYIGTTKESMPTGTPSMKRPARRGGIELHAMLKAVASTKIQLPNECISLAAALLRWRTPCQADSPSAPKFFTHMPAKESTAHGAK